MNVLDWLKASSRYTFEDATYEKIALDRGINADMDALYLSTQDRELMQADLIFIATFLSPSSTSSISVSHNGFQKSYGSETNLYQSSKVEYAKSIYKKYNDPNYDVIESSARRIKTLPIQDII